MTVQQAQSEAANEAASAGIGRLAEDFAATQSAIADAVTTTDPMPHILIDRVFSARLYQEICRHWPTTGHFRSIAETGRVPKGAYAERATFPLNRDALAPLAGSPAGIFWAAMADWLTGRDFVTAIVQKSAPYLLARFGQSCAGFRYGARAQLVSDRGGFSLGPHTDIPSRVFNLLFYCPQTDQVREFGTTLYAPKRSGFRCPGGPHYPFTDFNRVTTIDFLPNRLFGFFKTDQSWHGVEPMPALARDRRTLSVKIFTVDA